MAREGDHSCPQGFAGRRTLYRSMDEQRSCSACGCSTPQHSCVGTSLALATVFSCAPPHAPATLGACIALDTDPTDGNFGWTSVAPDTSDATCTPTGGQVTGTVVPDDPVTVCCLN